MSLDHLQFDVTVFARRPTLINVFSLTLSGTNRQKDVRGEQREMDAGLEECRPARDDRQDRDEARQGQQHNVKGIEAEMQ